MDPSSTPSSRPRRGWRERWRRFATALQNFNAALILGAFYLLLFVPFALPFMLLWDLLDTRRRKGSYWTPRENRLRDLPSLRSQGLPSSGRRKISLGKRLMRGALLLLYYPLLLILAGEGFMRLTGARYVTWYSAAEVAERHKPHGRFVWRGNSGGVREYAVEVRQNSGGWHDAEHAVAKPPGTFRVVVVGDSFIDAWQVPLEKSFHRRLEAELQAASASPVEVVAFGSSGTAQLWELETLKDDGFQYSPDLVIAEFLPLNDVRENSFILTRKAWLFQSALIDPFGKSWRYAPLRHFEILAAAAGKLNAVYHTFESLGLSGLEAAHPDLRVYLRDSNDPAWEQAWQITENAVARMQKMCSDRGARFLLCGFTSNYEVDSVLHDRATEREWTATYPPPSGARWDTRWPSERMAAFCRTSAIPYLDLVPPLAEHARRAKVRVNYALDGHWTEEGHRAAAEAVRKHLVDEGRVPKERR